MGVVVFRNIHQDKSIILTQKGIRNERNVGEWREIMERRERNERMQSRKGGGED